MNSLQTDADQAEDQSLDQPESRLSGQVERDELDATRPMIATFYDDADVVAKVSRGLGEPMVGINLDTLAPQERYPGRGW